MNLIHVRPAGDLRRDFARWAIQQAPKLRTVSEVEFAVPAHLYTHMPEELLLGAVVDGRPYVPVEPEPVGEHDSEAVAAFGALGGTDEPALAAVLEANARANASAGRDVAELPKSADEQTVCEAAGCDRVFDSPRGLQAHRRRAHKKAESTDAG